MRRPLALSPLAALAAAPPGAPQDQPLPPQPAPPPPPPARQQTGGVDHVGKFATTLTGRRWRVRGEVVPYVEGQHVVVRFFRDGKKFLAKHAAVKPGASGKAGHFKVSLRTKVSGTVTVRVTKEASATQLAIRAPAQHVLVLPDHVTPGTTGNAVRVLQRQLKALGYVPGRRGTYDARTGRAVLAFRKVSGLSRTSFADRALFRRLANGGGHFKVRYPG